MKVSWSVAPSLVISSQGGTVKDWASKGGGESEFCGSRVREGMPVASVAISSGRAVGAKAFYEFEFLMLWIWRQR